MFLDIIFLLLFFYRWYKGRG